MSTSTSGLEFRAAQALFAARSLERAIFSEGPWTMRWGGVTVPAVREVTGTGVTFSADFPDLCYLDRPDSGLLLLDGDEVIGIRRIDHPGDTGFVVRWEISVPDHVAVR